MRTTFSLPKDLKHRYNEHVRERFGIRNKSNWVNQAIVTMVQNDRGLSKVGLGDDLQANNDTDILKLDEETRVALTSAVRTLRRQMPEREGIQGLVIRSAIRARLRDEDSRQAESELVPTSEE